MIRKLWHIYRLGLKELISFRYDYVLVIMVIYSFTVMVIVPSKGTGRAGAQFIRSIRR